MSLRFTIVAAVRCAFVAVAIALGPLPLPAQRITTPAEQFGQPLGSDYFLTNYRQLTEYWQKLARESDRMRLERIGTTSEGRPMWMAVITSPENHARLTEYQEIARRLALAEGLTEAQARALAAEGKAVVWIDGGLHASEVLGAQQLMELVYELVSGTDAETMRFLRDVIVLAVHANPDGHDLVADWYMRRAQPLERSLDGVPRLYHKYIGHDNNRDFYLASQRETQAMDSILFRAWFPQIVYNHHQTAPRGTIMFAPPFRDPFNYNFDPLVMTMLDQVGAAMHSRMIAEGKPGTVMRGGASFSTWWNGGLRTTTYFHNMVGLLTETFGSPTPQRLTLVPHRLLPSGSLPYPIVAQPWRFRQSMDYSRTANRAVLDFASRHRAELLYGIYQMGRNSIERGSRDHWTTTPTTVARMIELVGGDTLRQTEAAQQRYLAAFRPAAERDARAYVIPASQPGFLTATKFVNALIKTGVTVHRATAQFEAAGRRYPANSYVVQAAQAFRPHVRDMFEPQDYPQDFQYPGGPPIAPYDIAGYTLALQMGIEYDRIVDELAGPFERITGFATAPRGRVSEHQAAAGYVLGRETNDAFAAVNRLLAAGHQVHWLRSGVATDARQYAAGAFFIVERPGTGALVREIAADRGLEFEAVATRPAVPSVPLHAPRIGLWDVYGGSMTSGWTRWLLEQYGFPFQLVFPPEIDAGDLRGRFDVLILPDDAIVVERERTPARARSDATAPVDAPAEWRARSGVLTRARSVPQLRRFLEEGGTILTIGSATSLAYDLGLPVRNALLNDADSAFRREEFYIPGSVLSMRIDHTHPIAHGMRERADVYFWHSPAFSLASDAEQQGIRRIGWYDSAAPLRSGWAWGQEHLDGTAGIVEIPVGRGALLMYGPEVLFRAQPHGTFKLLFNGLFYRAGDWQ